MPRLPLPPRLYVCGLDAMPEQVRALRPARVVSLLPAPDQPARPRSIRARDHLRLHVDDLDAPAPGFCAPTREHAGTLIDFLRASDPDRSVLFHCRAGISRSTAAALIALALDAPGREEEAMRLLRGAAPFAQPNRLLVGHADGLLERRGRLLAALDAVEPADLWAGTGLITLPRRLPRGGARAAAC